MTDNEIMEAAKLIEQRGWLTKGQDEMWSDKEVKSAQPFVVMLCRQGGAPTVHWLVGEAEAKTLIQDRLDTIRDRLVALGVSAP